MYTDPETVSCTEDIMIAVAKGSGCSVQAMSVSPQKTAWLISKNDRHFLLIDQVFYPNIPRWHQLLTANKIVTQQVLDTLNLATIPTTSIYGKNDAKEQLTASHTTHSFPVIIKPARGSKGLGIETAYNQDELLEGLKKCAAAETDVLVQDLFDHDEYRVFVFEGEVLLINGKEFPAIVGDGTRTVAELLTEKLPHHIDNRVLERELAAANLSPESIVPSGVQIKTHITKKPVPERYHPDNFPAGLVTWSKEFCKTVGLPTVGIDIFIEGTPEDPRAVHIIELNSSPGLYYLITHFDDQATAERIAEHVLNNYFNGQ